MDTVLRILAVISAATISAHGAADLVASFGAGRAVAAVALMTALLICGWAYWDAVDPLARAAQRERRE